MSILSPDIPRKSRDGWFYCATFHGKLFRFHPATEKLEELLNGPESSTASLTLSPDDRFLYYISGSQGTAWEQGCAVVQYDLRARRPKVIAFLGPYFEEKYGYRCGGTHGLALSEDGRKLFIAMNGSAAGQAKGRQAFGLPSIFLVQLTDAELK